MFAFRQKVVSLKKTILRLVVYIYLAHKKKKLVRMLQVFEVWKEIW